MNLYSSLLHNAAEHPDKTALIYFRTPISYGELSAMIRHYASVLYHEMGLRAGNIVTVSLPTTPESIAITYALNIIGVTACNVDLRFTAGQIAKIVARTNSKALFIMDFNIKTIALKAKDMGVEHIVVLRGNEYFPKAIVWSEIWDSINGRRRHMRRDRRFAYWCKIAKAQKLPEAPVYEWPADSTQLIFQTSGTTGNSKSAMISAENMNFPVIHCTDVLYNDWSADDIFLCMMPLFTISGFRSSIHSPLSLGNTVDIVPVWEASEFIKLIQIHRPQHIFSVPSFWTPLFEKGNANLDFSFLKTAILAGDIMNPEYEKRINHFLATHGYPYGLRKLYGMTETTIIALTPNNDENQYKAGFSGRITVGHQVQICDGEICVLTPTKALGYYDDPEATANLLRQHDDGQVWLHTGDLGHFDEQGNLYVDGRIKRMIVRHDGSKIFPMEIENALTRHPQVLNCAVVGMPDTDHPQSLLPAAFVTVTDSSVNENEIRKYAQETLPVHLQPSKIHIVKELPITKAGKTDYKNLEKLTMYNEQ